MDKKLLESDGASAMKSKAMTIGIIVPAPFSGGTMRAALNIAIQIYDGSRSYGEPVEVEFGYVDVGQADIHFGFRELERRSIPYRPIKLEHRDPQLFAPFTDDVQPGTNYVVFNDGVSNFDHADFLLIISDRVLDGVPAPTYRFGMVIYDFIQRYVPEILEGADRAESVANWRIATWMFRNYERAIAIFVTTNQARADAIAFGGAAARKITKLPISFDPIVAKSKPSIDAQEKKSRYIIWTSNLSPHKNHLRALEAIDMVYSSDSDFPDVVLTGVDTDRFYRDTYQKSKRKPYEERVCQKIGALKHSSGRLHFAGNLADDEYLGVLKNADLLFHPAVFDNGTFAILEAAWLGVPSVSARYSAMEEIARELNLSLTFFDPMDPENIARILKGAYQDRAKLKMELPSKQALEVFSRDARAVEIWLCVRSALLSGTP